MKAKRNNQGVERQGRARSRGDDSKVALRVLEERLDKQLLLYFNICTHCGLCADSCHYYAASHEPEMTPVYKAERLRQIYRRRHDWMGKAVPRLVGACELGEHALDRLVEVAFGSCTMCGRCALFCPMSIDTSRLVQATRNMLAAVNRVPKSLLEFVGQADNSGNIYGITKDDFIETMEWLEEELQGEVGDASARIPVDKVGARILYIPIPPQIRDYPLSILAAATIFYAAGEDWTLSSEVFDATNYGYFSGDDKAAGKQARRIAAEAERLKSGLIVPTECGHGYRVMRWEAENWLARPFPCRVKSFVELMAEYISQGRIKVDPSRIRAAVTYHDPCNHARNGGIIEEPRLILRHTVTDFVELEPNRENNWCCGGGGGLLLMKEFTGLRLTAAEMKAEQIRQSGARVVATTCHNCAVQLQDISRHYGLGIEVKLLAEVVADALVLGGRREKAPG